MIVSLTHVHTLNQASTSINTITFEFYTNQITGIQGKWIKTRETYFCSRTIHNLSLILEFDDVIRFLALEFDCFSEIELWDRLERERG